jgi:small subunit ribosomal protein S6e
MVFKINISEKSGKTYKLETEAEGIVGKELHEKIDGKIISPDLEGYELEITGTSDKSGFTSLDSVEGTGLKRVLLTYGKALHKRPKKEGKKEPSNPKPKGLRMRKTVRGKVISPEIIQINLKVIKEGAKKLDAIFGKPAEGEASTEAPKEEVKKE